MQSAKTFLFFLSFNLMLYSCEKQQAGKVDFRSAYAGKFELTYHVSAGDHQNTLVDTSYSFDAIISYQSEDSFKAPFNGVIYPALSIASLDGITYSQKYGIDQIGNLVYLGNFDHGGLIGFDSIFFQHQELAGNWYEFSLIGSRK